MFSTVRVRSVPKSWPATRHESSSALLSGLVGLSGGLVFSSSGIAEDMADDDDLNLPRSAVNKLIKETLPQVRVSNESRELIIQCCNEFIHLLSSEANEICNRNAKKTIMPEHVLDALETLGFGTYIQECREVLAECKHVALKKRRQSSRLENLGIPEEELLRQQQELFAKARQEQVELEQQEWLQMQQQIQLQQQPDYPIIQQPVDPTSQPDSQNSTITNE